MNRLLYGSPRNTPLEITLEIFVKWLPLIRKKVEERECYVVTKDDYQEFIVKRNEWNLAIGYSSLSSFSWRLLKFDKEEEARIFLKENSTEVTNFYNAILGLSLKPYHSDLEYVGITNYLSFDEPLMTDRILRLFFEVFSEAQRLNSDHAKPVSWRAQKLCYYLEIFVIPWSNPDSDSTFETITISGKEYCIGIGHRVIELMGGFDREGPGLYLLFWRRKEAEIFFEKSARKYIELLFLLNVNGETSFRS